MPSTVLGTLSPKSPHATRQSRAGEEIRVDPVGTTTLVLCWLSLAVSGVSPQQSPLQHWGHPSPGALSSSASHLCPSASLLTWTSSEHRLRDQSVSAEIADHILLGVFGLPVKPEKANRHSQSDPQEHRRGRRLGENGM